MYRLIEILSVIIVIALLALGVHSSIAYFAYPCEAYKTGYLSFSSYAPPRCTVNVD